MSDNDHGRLLHQQEIEQHAQRAARDFLEWQSIDDGLARMRNNVRPVTLHVFIEHGYPGLKGIPQAWEITNRAWEILADLKQDQNANEH